MHINTNWILKLLFMNDHIMQICFSTELVDTKSWWLTIGDDASSQLNKGTQGNLEQKQINIFVF